MDDKCKQEELGKEYEEWLDWVEPRLPAQSYQEELYMDVDKLILIKQILSRLALLEEMREKSRVNGDDVLGIETEIDHLRETLQIVMSGVCPVVKSTHAR